MALADRLREAMADADINQRELARLCDVAPPSVHGWLSGKSKFLRGENLLRAASALRVADQWLATGKGPKDRASHQLMESQPVRLNPVIVRVVAQALRETFHEELGRVYSVEEYPELFAGLYERTIARGEVGGNLVWLGMQIKGLAQQGAPMDERSGAVTDGEGDGKGNAGHPRKKAKA